LGFFGGLLVSPRGSTEEGDQLVFTLCNFGGISVGELPYGVLGWTYGSRQYVRGEVFY
jgi:hypothetical protein